MYGEIQEELKKGSSTFLDLAGEEVEAEMPPKDDRNTIDSENLPRNTDESENLPKDDRNATESENLPKDDRNTTESDNLPDDDRNTIDSKHDP